MVAGHPYPFLPEGSASSASVVVVVVRPARFMLLHVVCRLLKLPCRLRSRPVFTVPLGELPECLSEHEAILERRSQIGRQSPPLGGRAIYRTELRDDGIDEFAAPGVIWLHLAGSLVDEFTDASVYDRVVLDQFHLLPVVLLEVRDGLLVAVEQYPPGSELRGMPHAVGQTLGHLG